MLIHAGKEHSAVQGLRLLALYLKACSEQSDAAQSERSGEMHSMAAAAHSTARECTMQEWVVVCSDILPQVTHPALCPPGATACMEATKPGAAKPNVGKMVSAVQCVAMRGPPTVQCAALGVLSSLTESTYSPLGPAHQRQVWQAVQDHSASEPGSASAAHVAALKAAGALVLLPSSWLYPGMGTSAQAAQCAACEGLSHPVHRPCQHHHQCQGFCRSNPGGC